MRRLCRLSPQGEKGGRECARATHACTWFIFEMLGARSQEREGGAGEVLK